MRLVTFTLMVAVAASACDRPKPPPAVAVSDAASSAPDAAAPDDAATRPPEDAGAPDAKAAGPPRDAAPSATFRHAKRGFTLTYPRGLHVTQDATRAVLTSDPIATAPDRSGAAKARTLRLEIEVRLRATDVVGAAKQTNPALAAAFPTGAEARFAPQAGFSESATLDAGAAYTFVMGSHGLGERTTLVRAGARETFVVRCSTVSDDLSPTMSLDDQLAACDAVLTSLRR